MGQFSFLTADTQVPVYEVYGTPEKHMQTVYLKDNNNNVFIEHAYEGYGEFGGKDIYVLIAEMNGYGSDRNAGIDLHFNHIKTKNKDGNFITPIITEDSSIQWYDTDLIIDKNQGWYCNI